MNPKISVIIPIFGTEEYLDKCIKSVINQTFGDIEIICVDDCSPDDSYKIVEKYSAKDSRVSLIRHEKNLGLGGARNTAIRVAKADYIASVDSDDFMSPTMLQELWSAADNGWFDIVCCGFNRVDEADNILSYEAYEEKQIVNDNNEINIFAALNPAFWNKLWRKSLYIDNHIYFPTKDYFEDMSTTPRILAQARYIKVIKKRLYQYLIRPESITGSYSAKHILDYFKGFEIVLRYLEENDLYQRYEKEYLAYIRSNTHFHSKFILGSDKYEDEKKQYLQHLLLLRISFVENFQLIKTKDLGDLLNLLGQNDIPGDFNIKFHNTFKQLSQKTDLVKGLENTLNSVEKDLNEAAQKTESILKEQKILQQQRNEFKQQAISLKQQHQKETIKLAQEISDYEKKLKLLSEQNNKYSDKIGILESERADRLSLGQMSGVFIFSVLVRPTLNSRQYKKLKENPRLFFKDSKSKIARKIGSLLRVI